MEIIPLNGTWKIRLDPDNRGENKGWDGKSFDEHITLPGTTDEGGYSVHSEPEERTREHLTRTHRYEGAAWYRRTVTIPESWTGKRVVLVLERTRQTTLWINDERIGSQVCLSTPHTYDVTDAIEPGEHAVTLRVDNDADSMDREGVNRSHAKTKHAQTNWNGAVGDLRLEATDPVWVDDVRVDPNTEANEVSVRVTIGNGLGCAVEGELSVTARSRNTAETHIVEPVSRPVSIPESGTSVELDYDLGQDALVWDEFSPAVYELAAELKSDGGSHAHKIETTFGLRKFSASENGFSINGRAIFLRGRTDCCVFPETGYPPTTTAEWIDHMETAAEYGINHYRFHSWCPPEAAFEAADQVGIYLQPELSQWDARESLVDDADYKYYRREAERLLDAYGNHPSFVAFALGNENQGDEERMAELVRHCRAYDDDRRLYAYGANNYLSSPHPGEADDFWITANVPEDPDADPEAVDRTPIRGTGHVNDRPPSTTVDYDDLLADYSLPVVSHEIGQYQIYPDYDERRKYDGVLEPRNFERFEQSLADHHMADEDNTFRRASGELAITCYREEIEAAFRTSRLAGFQLLGLQDFPGQGTALVGILDAFMDSKGLIDPHEWRRFCSARVPLLRMNQYTWTDADDFGARAQVANYGPGPIKDATLAWSITDEDGREIAAGELTGDLPQGEVTTLGRIETALKAVRAPDRLVVEIAVEKTEIQSTYPIWVYPENVASSTDEVTIKRRFDDETQKLLANGETVLLVPEAASLRYSLEGAFQPDFWNYELFKRSGKPATMGMYCDSEHPVFGVFPTDGWSDWQWWRLLRHSHPIVLDDAPAEFRPTIGIVDNLYRNHKLGVLFETAVDNGKLAVCTLNLSAIEEPEVRQFRHELLTYLVSDAFDPEETVSAGVLESLMNGNRGN